MSAGEQNREVGMRTIQVPGETQREWTAHKVHPGRFGLHSSPTLRLSHDAELIIVKKTNTSYVGQ